VIILPFNIEVTCQKMRTTLNMITYTHFHLFVFKFKSNFTVICFTNNIMNQVTNGFLLNQD